MSAITGLLLMGCSVTDSEKVSDGTNQQVSRDGVRIGKKLENAYTLNNMRKANETVRAYESIEANKLYVCFKPQNKEQYDTIAYRQELTLFDYPLDYEILGEGSSVENPLGSNNGFVWQYSVVPVGYSFPDNVEYEILDELFIPEDDETRASNLLEEEALRITGHLEEEDVTRGKWTPKANIQVYDNVRGFYRPMPNVNVRVRKLVKWYDGYTNSKGDFSSSKRYRTSVHYSIKWESSDGIWDVRDNAIGQAFLRGPKNKSKWYVKLNIDDDGDDWFIGSVYYYANEVMKRNNEYTKYTSLCARLINNPYDKKCNPYRSFRIVSDKKGHYNNVDIFKYDDKKGCRNSAEVYTAVAYAIGLKQYYKRIGTDYEDWNTSQSFNRSSLMHTWALTRVLNTNIFGYYSLPVKQEGYLPFWSYRFTKDLMQYQDKWEFRSATYFTSIGNDVIDTHNQSKINDRVSGYTLSQVWSCIKDASSMADFKARLKRINNPTKKYIDELFRNINL